MRKADQHARRQVLNGGNVEMKKTKKFGQPVVKQTPNSGGILTKGSAPGTFREAPDLRTALPPNPNPPGRAAPDLRTALPPNPNPPGRYDVNPPTSGAGGVMPKPMGGGLSSGKFGAPSMGAGPLPSPVAPPPAGGMMPQTGGMKKGGKVQVKSKASSASKVRGHGCETRGKTKGRFV